MKHNQTKFTSRWGFILSAVGSAVGMANVWGFPAKMGANGGGAFFVAYLIFVALFSMVGLSAEYAVGRRSRTGTLGSYRNAWISRSPRLGKAGSLVGWLPLAGSMCIAIGYAVIIAYVLKAFFDSITGELTVTTAVPIEGDFSGSFTLEGPDGEMTVTDMYGNATTYTGTAQLNLSSNPIYIQGDLSTLTAN